MSVNSSGAVTGIAYSTNPSSYPYGMQTFLYTGGSAGTMNNIGSKIGVVLTYGAAIKDDGKIAAYGIVSKDNGWLYSGGTNGTKTQLLYPGQTYGTYCYAMNNAGDITGTILANTIPFLRTSDGTWYNLGDIYGKGGTACDVTGNGYAAGWVGAYYTGTPPPTPNKVAAYWQYSISGGVLTSTPTNVSSYLDPGDYQCSFGLAINNSGLMVGASSSTWDWKISNLDPTWLYNTATHDVTWLSDLGVRFDAAYNGRANVGLSQIINNAGQVVGEVQQPDLTWHAVVWDATNGVRRPEHVVRQSASDGLCAQRRFGDRRLRKHRRLWNGLGGAHRPTVPYQRPVPEPSRPVGGKRAVGLVSLRVAETEISCRSRITPLSCKRERGRG